MWRDTCCSIEPRTDLARTWLQTHAGVPDADGQYSVERHRATVLLRALYRTGATMHGECAAAAHEQTPPAACQRGGGGGEGRSARCGAGWAEARRTSGARVSVGGAGGTEQPRGTGVERL